MFKTKKTRYASLFIALIIGFSISVIPTFAASIQKQITVATGIHIFVDDAELNPVDSNGNPLESFIYNGTTYLPVRAISEAMGKPITWDGKSRSVYIGKHESDEPAILLQDLDYYNAGRFDSVYNSNLMKLGTRKDNFGKERSNSLSGGTWSYYYRINDQYSKITGTLFMLYETRTVSDKGILQIYGDGKLLYEATVQAGDDPIDFSVDLEGVLDLNVYFDGYNGSWGVRYSEYAAISNVGLYT